MWNLSVSGQGVGGIRYDGGWAGQHLRNVSRSEGIKEDNGDDKQTVTQLLKALDDAEKTSKSQVAQQLRDKLNEKRQELGEEKFKEIIEQLKKEASERWLELLKALFPDLFPDESSPAPAPPSGHGGRGGGGGGGGGGGRVNPNNYGSSESMSNKPFTEGARHANYTPDKSNPGKKPGMGKEPGNIWSGFRQGPDGNCVTVSAIKAAMMRFGQKPTDIFRDVKMSGDGYDVQMRDGVNVHLTKGELKQAAEQARFMGDDPAMMTDANFLYAVSAKRAQMENNDGVAARSYGDALQSLNNGEGPREALDRLGLKAHVRQTTSAELARGVIGVASDNRHSMAVIGGHLELWGRRGGSPTQPDAFALM